MSGFLCFIPPVLTLILALRSKNIFVSLFVGIVVSSIIANGWNFVPPIIENYMVNGITGNINIFIMLSIFGILMATVQATGGFAAFSNITEKKIKSPRAAAFITWLLAFLITDGSVSTIGVGTIMRSTNDKQKVPREKIGLILSSTGPSVCALVPWTVYLLAFSGMIQSFDPSMDGTATYLTSIPFQFYSFISIIVALLVALGVFPSMGYLKKCEKRVKETGEMVAPGSNVAVANFSVDEVAPNAKPSIFTFVLPFCIAIVLLVISYFKNGMVVITTPFLVGLLTLIVYALIRKFIKISDIPMLIVKGFNSVGPIIVLLAFAFTFSKAVSAIGLAQVAAGALMNLPNEIMPALIFLLCAVVSYASGSLLTASSMLLPIAIVLGHIPGANMALMIAACIGGSSFGDSSSPLSDMVVQSATGAGCDVVELGRAQLPAKAIMATVSMIIFVIMGFIV